MSNHEIQQMKDGAWGWTIFGVVLSFLAIATEDIPIAAAVIANLWAVIMWTATINAEQNAKAENDELFGKKKEDE